MTLPLYRVGAGPNLNLQEFGDADFARLIYRTQEAFARQLQLGGQGAIFNGNGGTRIGSAVDSASTANTNTNRVRFPAFPGITQANVMTYNYGQNPVTVAQPTIATSGANEGWLCYTGPRVLNAAGDRSFVTETDVQTVIDRIITPALADLRAGGVGSYQVSTRTPGAGWVDVGRWFLDTRFDTNTDYRLWLRTTAGLPVVNRQPLQTGFVEMNTDRDSDFVQNICLPLITRVAPTYRIRNDRVGTRGLWTDTRLTQSANTTNPPGFRPGQRPGGVGDNYRSISTPTGAGVTINTYTLEQV